MIRIKTAILLAGDVVLLYGALALTLLIRYGAVDFNQSFITHFKPFSLIFIIWIIIFYLIDLYELRALKNPLQLLQRIGAAIALSIAISVILFYLLVDFFELTPKTNLAIFGLIFGIVDFGWRLTVAKSRFAVTKVLFIGDSPAIREIISHLENNPQIGYEIIQQLKKPDEHSIDKFEKLINENNVDVVVISAKNNPAAIKLVYDILYLKISIINSADFYEAIFQKEALDELEEEWFIEKITTRRNFYDALKRLIDLILGLSLIVLFSPIMLIVALLTKLSPRRGPVILKQKRTGINNKTFTLFKFGTMLQDAGALWTAEKDNRVTSLGKILRYTHLDEIPQLWNIVRGDISFIGPRAERTELTELYGQLPRYEMRHIIKPGLTGWAQLNYKPSASLEEAYEKLKYDIYYIKNRSLVLDILIIIKTIKLFFGQKK